MLCILVEEKRLPIQDVVVEQFGFRETTTVAQLIDGMRAVGPTLEHMSTMTAAEKRSHLARIAPFALDRAEDVLDRAMELGDAPKIIRAIFLRIRGRAQTDKFFTALASLTDVDKIYVLSNTPFMLANEEQIDKFLAVVARITAATARASVLKDICENIKTSSQIDILLRIVESLISDSDKKKVLVNFPPLLELTDPQKEKVYDIVAAMQDDEAKASILGYFYPLKPIHNDRFLTLADSIWSEALKAKVLSHFRYSGATTAHLDRYVAILTSMRTEHGKYSLLIMMHWNSFADEHLAQILPIIASLSQSRQKGHILRNITARMTTPVLGSAFLNIVATLEPDDKRTVLEDFVAPTWWQSLRHSILIFKSWIL